MAYSNCPSIRIVPMFLPILTPSGKKTESESLRFVELWCWRRAGHDGKHRAKGREWS